MVIFHGYVSLPEGRWPLKWLLVTVWITYWVDSRQNPANSPVEGTGSLHIPFLTLGLSTIPNGGWEWDFFHHPQDRRSSHHPPIFPGSTGPRKSPAFAQGSGPEYLGPLSWDNCQIGGFSLKKSQGTTKNVCYMNVNIRTYMNQYVYMYVYRI